MTWAVAVDTASVPASGVVVARISGLFSETKCNRTVVPSGILRASIATVTGPAELITTSAGSRTTAHAYYLRRILVRCFYDCGTRDIQYNRLHLMSIDLVSFAYSYLQ